MVLKTQLILVAAFISGFLLTLQFIFLQLVVRRNQPDSDPVWRTLYTVSTTALRSDIPLFLVDPFLLPFVLNHGKVQTSHQSLVPDKDGRSYCQALCHGQKFTQLATLGDLIDANNVQQLIHDLQGQGYTILTVYEEVDSENIFHVPRLLHVLVLDEKLSPKDGHVVIIAVFYEKVRDNWWRGDLTLSPADERLLFRQGIRKTDFRHKDRSTLFVKTEMAAAIVDGMVLNLPDEGAEVFLHQESHLPFVPCNRTRSREFEEKHPSNDADIEQNRLFRLKVKRILGTASRLLNKLKIPFWLSSGTLLGYFRSCDVIHYGKDVDIGIAIKDYRPELIDVFTMNDLMLMHSFGRVNDSFELSFRNEDTKLDIFFFYEESDHVWNGGTSTSTGFKYKYTFPRFHLCWTEFLGLKLRIPCHSTLAYIEANYGSDWHRPVRQWDWKTSPPNVSPNGQWSREEWPEAIQSFTLPPLRK